MPLTIEYVSNGEGIEVTAHGSITPLEIIQAYNEIYREENIRDRRYFLIDRSQADESAMAHDGIRTIASYDMAALKINPRFIIAHVAPTDLQFGLTRIWDAYMDDEKSRTGIFRDRKSAEEWIAQLRTTF